MKILIAIGSKKYSKSTLRAGMKVAQAFNAKATIIDVGEKISAFSNQLVDLAQDQMESLGPNIPNSKLNKEYERYH